MISIPDVGDGLEKRRGEKIELNSIRMLSLDNPNSKSKEESSGVDSEAELR